jgi:hypothetical protein
MPRDVDRERWEAYLMMVLLATRPFLFVGAVILLLYAIAAFSAYPLIGVIAFGLSLLLFLLVFYDQASLLIARLGAWLITIGKE